MQRQTRRSCSSTTIKDQGAVLADLRDRSEGRSRPDGSADCAVQLDLAGAGCQGDVRGGELLDFDLLHLTLVLKARVAHRGSTSLVEIEILLDLRSTGCSMRSAASPRRQQRAGPAEHGLLPVRHQHREIHDYDEANVPSQASRSPAYRPDQRGSRADRIFLAVGRIADVTSTRCAPVAVRPQQMATATSRPSRAGADNPSASSRKPSPLSSNKAGRPNLVSTKAYQPKAVSQYSSVARVRRRSPS